MITLNDYLGTLISSVNQARVMADIESARIAKLYAQDPLLKHYSIPRFRAQDIELDIPIAIDSFEKSTIRDYQPIDNKSFNSIGYSILKDIAGVDSFSSATSKVVKSKIAESTRNLEQDLKASVPEKTALHSFTVGMEGLFKEAVEMDAIKIKDIEVSQNLLRKSLEETLFTGIKSKESSEQLEHANVIVEAAKLREIPAENIIRIKMKLYEDGMEWITSKNSNGEIESRLLPE
ncbi:MAG: hypothetical protein JKY08_04170 [Flavobacteriaceae bacterium]|nr:hypothetical protein [Flavobacteriaceae bacterium]